MVLFTRDLRTHDHPALWEGTRVADDVVPVFFVDPGVIGRSANRDRFLSECLVDLDRSLAHRGGRLIVREGPAAPAAVELATDAGCDEIFLTADVSGYAGRRAEQLTSLAAVRAIGVRAFPGHAVVEPGIVAPEGREAYRVFGPYLRAWDSAHPRQVLGSPHRVRVPRGLDAGRLPVPERSTPTALELPPGGESTGRKRMQRFLSVGAAAYTHARDDLAADETSRLSPYLRFGCISAAELASRAQGIRGAEGFVRQLAWRDFFRQLLAWCPSMTWDDLRPGAGEQVEFDGAIVEAWVAGRTGLPLVDAGMRQLSREGWMHNRARLVTASFLTRQAGVPWQVGARHFFEQLVDGDPANNAGNWQWVAGTGASPRRSRPLNPVRQAERFDPDGAYVRRYVPELLHADGQAILRPWSHPELLRASGYPVPILDTAA